MPKITLDQAAAWNLLQLGLIEPFATPLETVSRLVALQAQNYAEACKALALRTLPVDKGDGRGQLDPMTGKEVVRMWTIRGTLHLVPEQEAAYHLAATANDWFDRWGRYLDKRLPIPRGRMKLELYPEITGVLGEEPLGYREIAAAAGLGPPYLKLLRHLMRDLCYLGLCVRGPHDGQRATYLRAYYPQMPGLSQRQAQEWLLKRFITGYGPVTLADMVYWSGWRVPVVRDLSRALSKSLVEVEIEGQAQPAFMCKEQLEPLLALRPARPLPEHFLPAFDVLLLAYKNKSRFLTEQEVKKIFLSAARVSPCILQNGRIVGTWQVNQPEVKTFF